MSETKMTTDHEKIRKWVEARGGCPAHVKGMGRRGDPGVLRIDYTGFSGKETLEPISWSDWFDAFDKKKLGFLYEDKPRSRFSKLVERDVKSATRRRVSAAKRNTAKRAGAKRSTTKRATAKRASTRPKTTRASSVRRTKRPTATRRATPKRASTKRAAGKSTSRARSSRT
jgi:hypothetical protein